MAERITAEQFPEAVLQSQVPVLVDFYSDSCVPCKRLSPLLSKLEAEYEGKLSIYKVNVQYEKDLVAQYEIQAAPTIVFFAGGAEVSRIRGAVSKDALIEAINQTLSS